MSGYPIGLINRLNFFTSDADKLPSLFGSEFHPTGSWRNTLYSPFSHLYSYFLSEQNKQDLQRQTVLGLQQQIQAEYRWIRHTLDTIDQRSQEINFSRTCETIRDMMALGRYLQDHSDVLEKRFSKVLGIDCDSFAMRQLREIPKEIERNDNFFRWATFSKKTVPLDALNQLLKKEELSSLHNHELRQWIDDSNKNFKKLHNIDYYGFYKFLYWIVTGYKHPKEKIAFLTHALDLHGMNLFRKKDFLYPASLSIHLSKELEKYGLPLETVEAMKQALDEDHVSNKHVYKDEEGMVILFGPERWFMTFKDNPLRAYIALGVDTTNSSLHFLKIISDPYPPAQYTTHICTEEEVPNLTAEKLSLEDLREKSLVLDNNDTDQVHIVHYENLFPIELQRRPHLEELDIDSAAQRQALARLVKDMIEKDHSNYFIWSAMRFDTDENHWVHLHPIPNYSYFNFAAMERRFIEKTQNLVYLSSLFQESSMQDQPCAVLMRESIYNLTDCLINRNDPFWYEEESAIAERIASFYLRAHERHKINITEKQLSLYARDCADTFVEIRKWIAHLQQEAVGLYSEVHEDTNFTKLLCLTLISFQKQRYTFIQIPDFLHSYLKGLIHQFVPYIHSLFKDIVNNPDKTWVVLAKGFLNLDNDASKEELAKYSSPIIEYFEKRYQKLHPDVRGIAGDAEFLFDTDQKNWEKIFVTAIADFALGIVNAHMTFKEKQEQDPSIEVPPLEALYPIALKMIKEQCFCLSDQQRISEKIQKKYEESKAATEPPPSPSDP